MNGTLARKRNGGNAKEAPLRAGKPRLLASTLPGDGMHRLPEKICSATPVGYVTLCRQGRIQTLNAAATKLLACKRKRLPGTELAGFLVPGQRDAFRTYLDRCRKGARLLTATFTVTGGDRPARNVQVHARAAKEKPGSWSGYCLTLIDITNFVQKQENLLLAQHQLAARVRERTAALMAEMQERQQLEREILELKDNEQKRIINRLHEGLGQHLTGVAFLASALERDLTSRDAPEARQAAMIAELVNRAISQSRELAHGIDPIPAGGNGLELALCDLAAGSTQRARTLKCVFRCDPGVLVHEPGIATHVFRIAEEAVCNAVMHSRARRLRVELRAAPPGAVLIVSDNGVGLELPRALGHGKGLVIMRYRARLIGACLNVRRGRRGGTEVTCWFPTATLPAPHSYEESKRRKAF